MGIEEMINEYKKQIENNMKYIEGEWACEADRISGMKIAVDVLRKIVKDLQLLKSSLPTQQGETVVPVVKQFIADWYEENKRDLDYKIWAYIYDFDSQDQSEFCKWMNNRLNNPIETLIRMKDGYTVEKEQLYEVRLPYEQWDEDSAEVKTEVAILAYDNTSDETKFVSSGTKCFSNNHKTKLSEERIKLIDERYWAFAVPVEEDE